MYNMGNHKSTCLFNFVLVFVLLQFTDSDYPFGIFKLDLPLINCIQNYLVLYFACIFHWIAKYGWCMVFNATFNNISVISWRSVLLVGETGVLLSVLLQFTDSDYPFGIFKFFFPMLCFIFGGRHDCMIVGFTTTCTCAISAYHHYSCEFESHS
jgi:hypothetical protein